MIPAMVETEKANVATKHDIKNILLSKATSGAMKEQNIF
jgi:hypothetical protein